MSAQDKHELARMDQHLNRLPTETAKDAYLVGLATKIKTSAPVLPPMKPAAPARSLDEQFAALATQTDKSEFLAKHRLAILKR